jgi:hypothetical protein
MPDGRVHGVFTWTLLKGLRGGAADEGPDHRREPAHLPVQRHAGVPTRECVQDRFGRPAAVRPRGPGHGVRPVARPTEVQGAPHRTADRGRPAAADLGRPAVHRGRRTGADRRRVGRGAGRGLYVAELPGLRHGFQVSGAGDVDVAVTGTGPRCRTGPAPGGSG